MPELPDIELYLHALRPRVVDRELRGVRLGSPFVLRSVEPPLADVEGRTVVGLRRLGKRIVFALDGDRFVVLHLMISGRLRWRAVADGAKPPAIPKRIGLAAFDLDGGTLILTEQGTRKRAALHVVAGEDGLAAHDPGGIEVLGSDPAAFRAALTRENHTLKRALTDPRLLSGIGNAYSDEILHRARLSPFKQTSRLDDAAWARLHDAAVTTLTEWTERLRAEAGEGFPAKVTAFRPEMAVHGKYREPCPDCGAKVQRIRYADNEANYCANCQTAGRLLADRGLSRLLKRDWPRTLDELEARMAGEAAPPATAAPDRPRTPRRRR